MAAEAQLVDLDFKGASRGINHLDPASPQDVATKAYVDAHVPTAGTQRTFAYFMGG